MSTKGSASNYTTNTTATALSAYLHRHMPHALCQYCLCHLCRGAPASLPQTIDDWPAPAVQHCRYGASCKYSHEETSLVKLLARLKAAQRGVDVCVFTITCDDIANALLDLHKAGKQVRIVTDDEQARPRSACFVDSASRASWCAQYCVLMWLHTWSWRTKRASRSWWSPAMRRARRCSICAFVRCMRRGVASAAALPSAMLHRSCV